MTAIQDLSSSRQSLPLTIERIETKTITVGVIGMGYVGFPLSLTFSSANVKVIGFDIDSQKVEAINKGESYIHHIDASHLKEVISKEMLSASTDFSDVALCDILVICVPTPLDPHLEPDLSYVKETCEHMAPHLKPHTLVCLESTTWPGTTEEVVQPILEQGSKRRVGNDLYLCFSPEREDPGNRNFTTKTIPKLVGGVNAESLELAHAFYSLAIETVIPLKSTKSAELAKLFENIFRSVNIALVNELKMICEPMGVDVWEVIEAAATKPFGFMPFWPGPGLGGHCIPIDPFYLTWKAKEHGVTTRFIELAGEINRAMPKYVISKVQDCLNTFKKPLKESKILILGLAYKPDIDDMRESPSLELMKLLIEQGAIVEFHDPHLPIIGKTRHYNTLSGKTHHPLSKEFDCFILSTRHSCFSAEEILSYTVPIVDTRNFFPRTHPLVFPA